MRANPVRKFNKWAASMVLAFALCTCTPHSAFASKPSDDDPSSHYDARVLGYDPDVELPISTGGGNWVMLILSAVVCISVIFKDAKRSHLD